MNAKTEPKRMPDLSLDVEPVRFQVLALITVGSAS
jgi:hypothetical protein